MRISATKVEVHKYGVPWRTVRRTPDSKQRHTVKRIFDRLVGAQGAAGISYPTIRACVAARRNPTVRAYVAARRNPTVRAYVAARRNPTVRAHVAARRKEIRGKAGSILGRLTFGGNFIETCTEFYRLARTKAQTERAAAQA
jgi:hypothetical protein